jgi:uncharacterized protein (TIGR02996 family)
MTPDAFLAQIREEPDDRTTRMVFADWLEDHDQPARAEFLRTQLQLSTLDESDPAREQLLALERRLLVENEAKWLGELPEHVVGWRWHEGFVDEVHFAHSNSLAELEPFLHRHPVRMLRLLSHESVENLPQEPSLALIGDLELYQLHQSTTSYHLRQLVSANATQHLRRLTLHGAGLDANFVRQLVQHGPPNLRGLDMQGNPLDNTDLARLIQAPRLRHLRELRMDGYYLDLLGFDDLMNAAARWERLHGWFDRNHPLDTSRLSECTNLRRLGLMFHRPPIGEAALPSSLVELEVSGSDDAPLAFLSRSWLPPNLRRLTVDLDELRQEEPISALLTRVKKPIVDLRIGAIGNDERTPWAQSQACVKNLRSLVMPRTNTTPVLQNGTLTGLRQLHLNYSEARYGAEELCEILRNPSLFNLESLQIFGPADDSIVRSPTLKRLRELRLRGRFTSVSLDSLAEWPGLWLLDRLELENTMTGNVEPALDRLSRSRYLCPLTRVSLVHFHMNAKIQGQFREILGRRFN